MIINQALNGSNINCESPKVVCKGVITFSPPVSTITEKVMENAAITNEDKNETQPAITGLHKGTIIREMITPINGRKSRFGICDL